MIDLSMAAIKVPYKMIKDKWILDTSLYLGFLSYSPMHQIEIETSRYKLMTVSKLTHLKELFQLRSRIFLDNDTELDIDQYDQECDHLAILDKSTNSFCGTYRINCSRYTSKFYSSEEFDLGDFEKSDEVKIELGRACIDPAHRNGVVIDLLWKGIAKYAELTKARFIFGCSSVYTTNYHEALALYNYLGERGKVSNNYLMGTKKQYSFSTLYTRDCDFTDVNYQENERAREILPSLLKSYLLAGAQVHGIPALDMDFSCSDFLTILDVREVSHSFKRRYFKYLM